MTKEQETFVKELKNNVAFQLSLSSKELFHSNFLAWLAEDEKTRGVFNELLHTCFGVDWDFNPDTIMVKREYKNFDLCICQKVKDEKTGDGAEKYIPGAVLFVLENKFKSIPYKEQLIKYQEHISELNKGTDVQTNYILLSLTENFTGNGNWKFVSYSQYIEALSKANEKLQANSCYHELIVKYCEFIRLFSDHIKTCMKEEICDKDTILPTATWSSLINHQEFYDIRCYDIWQKIVMQYCAYILAKMVKKELGKDKEVIMAHSDRDIWQKNGTENKGKFFTMVNFFHGEALLELKYLIPEKGILVLQQQGNTPLRIGVLAMNKDHGISASLKKKDLQKWENHVNQHIAKCGLKGLITLKEENVDEKKVFKSYGSFYYCNLKGEVTPILQTLQDMVDEMKKLVAEL